MMRLRSETTIDGRSMEMVEEFESKTMRIRKTLNLESLQ